MSKNMNTKIRYFYRDGANYKTYPKGDVIVAGQLTDAELRPHLREDNRFIPSDLGLPKLQSQLENYPNRDDHIWHEFVEIEHTDELPTVEVTADEIRARLQQIAKQGWNEMRAIEELEGERMTFR
jgi:hypothetical protein